MKIRRTTIVLSIVFLVSLAAFVALFIVWPRIKRIHPKCRLYGGLTDELKDSSLYEDMQSGQSFCFVGDSITSGLVTDGIPWYEPLVPYIRGDISNISVAGYTVIEMINSKNEIPYADIYVIAIGVNDVTILKPDMSAATSDEYIDRIDQLSEILWDISPDAKLYFIAPWPYITDDEVINGRHDQFCSVLEDWCSRSDAIYLDPTATILSVMDEEGISTFTQDGLHPNAPEGIGLYSYAVLKADHDRQTV